METVSLGGRKMNIKTLQEINREFLSVNQRQTRNKRLKRVLVFLMDTAFFLAVFLILILLFTVATETGRYRSFLGYSLFTVTGNSMNGEIPRNSLILVKSISVHDLMVGDNITFVKDRYTVLAHKIIEIHEDYGNGRGFQTKGINNAFPDSHIVNEGDVIGKVIRVYPGIGAAVFFLSKKLPIILIILGAGALLMYCFYRLIRHARKETHRPAGHVPDELINRRRQS